MNQTGELWGLGSCSSVYLDWVLYVNQVLSSLPFPQSAGPILVCVFFIPNLLLFLLLIQIRVICLSSLEFLLPISPINPLVPGKTLLLSYFDSNSVISLDPFQQQPFPDPFCLSE